MFGSSAKTDRYAIDLHFRTVATVYAVLFFGTILISAIMTKTLTEFDPKTDKILLFFGKMNPCVFFDHYPAKVMGLVGMGAFCACSVVWSLMLLLRMIVEGRLVPQLWTTAVVGFGILCDVNFINIFVTDLYPGEGRRLHVHDAEDLSSVELSSEEMNLIKVHSGYYVALICANLWMFAHVLHIQKNRFAKWSVKNKVLFGGLMALGFYGLGMHLAAASLTVSHNRTQLDWIADKSTASTFHGIVLDISNHTKTSMWGFFVILMLRFLMPKGSGIKLSFQLSKTQGDHGLVMPDWLMGRTMRFIAVIFAFGGVVNNEFDKDSGASSQFSLAKVLREAPFSYFLAPAFFACVIIGGISMGLSVVSRRLLFGSFPVALSLTGIVMSFASFGSMIIVIPQQKYSWVFLGLFILSYMAWVVQMNVLGLAEGLASKTSVAMSAGYVVAGIGILVGMHFVSCWSLDYLFCAWLCLYNLVTPETKGMYLTVEKIVGEDDMHAYDSVEEQGNA